MASSKLLICTVGGSPEPVVAALKQWRPARVWFVHTPQTRGDIEATLVPKARDEGVDLDAGRYDLFELPDGQDLAGCLGRLRRLTPEVMQWAARGHEFQVVVDFTGGTKCMSAAIGLEASRWPCIFSYVGGGKRTKEGVGVVVSGTEKIVYQANPWDALGHQAVDDFVVLFDQHSFLAAANVVDAAKKRMTREDRKRELAVLENLAKAFDAWDRFDHPKSRNILASIAKSANDLRAVLGVSKADQVLEGVARLASHLDAVCASATPSRHHVVDLLANAKRRKDEGRIDDAVARLYRAIEAVAQVTLKEGHGIDSTERVPLDRIPEALRVELTSRAKDGIVALGLQDAYALLACLGSPVWDKFHDSGMHGAESPLTARNRSILAHGFERVSEKVSESLWQAALKISEVTEDMLPAFPFLGSRHRTGIGEA